MTVKIMQSRKKHKKLVITLILVLAGLIAVTSIGCFAISEITGVYKKQLDEFKMKEYQSKRMVYVPRAKIKYDSVLGENMFDVVQISSSVPQSSYMSKEDIGKVSAIDIEAGIPVMKCMLADSKIPDDLREEEFNMFMIQTNLAKNDYVDLRICFPNGEDYIVVSKKKINNIDLKNNVIWTYLDEKEIMTVSCAVIDAYLRKGTKLYVVKYVQPVIQKQAIPTYPVNNDVIQVMNSDPNILSKAGNALAAQARLNLETRLLKLSPESVSNVSTGVSEDLNKRIENASQQGTQQAPAEAKPGAAGEQNKSNREGSEENGFIN